ncbi:OLC1v1024226C1 [Oldenlandia corymbosa var. corymbosa]|uniref:OLC1v1024226C1 n=1 Tax=Oldenlandia corymbosa var. corymbosa TaxID=529605 RepID=A0AAV1C218_OLDCO|nr:OLC1v1024226C1 [Oldenlandia corymbosa var. corymbosa]
MAVPDAAVSFLLENVGQLLSYNRHLIADVKENIEKLEADLKVLKILMVDFSNYTDNDSELLKQTMKDIKSTLWKAEDAIDNYIVQADLRTSRPGFSGACHGVTDFAVVLGEVGREIEVICKKVEELRAQRVWSGFEAISSNFNKTAESSEAHKVEEEQLIIGFDGAAEYLVDCLVKGPKQLEVISIVGMCGLGKTTLAKRVFKDPHVTYEFMDKVFIYVSRDYDKKKVMLEILASFAEINDEVSNLDEERLENYLRQQLEGRTYLVILDDVWEKNDWDRFKFAFPNNNKRCRVLMTTRNAEVAMYAHPNNPNYWYKLDFLSLDHSQELLRLKIFQKNECPPKFAEYVMKIASKCYGLPLALVLNAEMLMNHPENIDWWREVFNNLSDYKARDITQVTKLIYFSYKQLPNHLKRCFLYLGLFRKDFEIPVWKLVRLWISEGLIQQEGNLDMEVVAEKYLEELVFRSLVMVGRRRSNGKMKTCLLHGTLRGFCHREAVEENFFQEITMDNLSSFGLGNLDQYRRLCINDVNVSHFLSVATAGKCVRSFLTCPREDMAVELKLVRSISKASKLLRVLEVQSLIFPRFPPEFYGLVLLKYISINFRNGIIPQAFSKLWNLQTLIVKTSSPTLEIQADIWKMPHFRHLHTNRATSFPCPNANSQLEGKEGALWPKNVQTLCTISPESCKREVFNQTPKLKKLGIYGSLSKLFELDGGASFFACLNKLESLENLKLLNSDMNSRLYILPLKKSFPPQLTRLTLLNTRLDWIEMSVLGELDTLEVLKLKEFSFQGNMWEAEKGGFKHLKHLYIGSTGLVVWKASGDHFPQLKSLELNGCEELQELPYGLADIPTLQSVVLHHTNSSVASSARKLLKLKLLQANKGDRNIIKLSVFPPDH